MGKPFNNELKMLGYTIKWAEDQDVTCLSNFLFHQDSKYPLICIGSGGSLSACRYAAQLSKLRNGVLCAAMTPLELIYSGCDVISNSKLLYLSASGKNKDIQNAIKYGIKYNETAMMSLTLRKGNPTDEMLKKCPKVLNWCEDIPSGKDGFLATNSLVATYSLLCRAYDQHTNLSNIFFSDRELLPNTVDLSLVENFLVLYGAIGEPIAYDIESKLTEAALGATLLSDYRNFGHGRHHWFAKRRGNSCIIALISPLEKELAYKTISSLPQDIMVIYIETEQHFPQASIDLLIKAFQFVQMLGESRGIDPGKPGVPSYGRKLYNLNYFKLTNTILPSVPIEDVAIKRKLGISRNVNIDLWRHYSHAYQKFITQLNKGIFTVLVFDYDGTLSATDSNSRFADKLRNDVMESLEKLLMKGADIRIATGRGKSVGSVLRRSIDKKYWKQVKVGYYNGACISALDEEYALKKWKEQPLDENLKILEENIKKRIPQITINYKFTERNKQLSIENVTSTQEAEIIYHTCCEIIWDKQLKDIHVWRSSHSMDIIVYREVGKLCVVDDPEHTLCIGDYGCIEGNDYELLTIRASLSVDKVSKNAESCWNIAPSGVTGLDATLYYLNHLSVTDGIIKCKFNV